jgi:hypothetical protein
MLLPVKKEITGIILTVFCVSGKMKQVHWNETGILKSIQGGQYEFV